MISGDIPVLIIENIYNDSVCEFVPAQKNEIKKSSKDKINTSKLAEIITGFNNGKIIYLKVCHLDAPKSKLASMTLKSISFTPV